jgi:hypothetical protein
MADPTHEPFHVMDLLKPAWLWVLTMFQALILWVARQQIRRIDVLETKSATKDDLTKQKEDTDETTKRIEGLMREHRDETRASFAAVNRTLTEILLRLPRDQNNQR